MGFGGIFEDSVDFICSHSLWAQTFHRRCKDVTRTSECSKDVYWASIGRSVPIGFQMSFGNQSQVKTRYVDDVIYEKVYRILKKNHVLFFT